MANPFKPDDKVLTLRKGIEIEATVRTTWNHEVQVRTADGDLLWRTMKTIRRAGGEETLPPTAAPEVAPSMLDEALHAIEYDERPTQEASATEDTQSQDAPASGEPAETEPDEAAPAATEHESTAENHSMGHVDEPSTSQQESTVPKPKKRRKGILRKFMFDDNYDQ